MNQLRAGLKRMLLRGVVMLVFAVCAGVCAADEARKILGEMESRHRTKTQEYTGDLVVVSKEGKERRKGWRSFREGFAGDAKQLIRFTDPPEVRGVGFLSVGRPAGTPDQWLYLPSMKRERRIASQDRESSFVGTDFSYEDMEEFDHTKYEVAQLADTTLDGQPCLVIEARPKERSAYEKRILTIRKDILFMVRGEAFRKGEKDPAKRLVFSEIQQIDGHWVARKMEMLDLRKGSRTTVLLKGIAFDRPQSADRFTLQNLNREGGE